MINDRRRFKRVFFESFARISDDNVSWPTRVRDLSLKGALVDQPENYMATLQRNVVLEIVLLPETSIFMDCRVVYANGKTMGLECMQIDIESMTHLKRLIELNSDESEFVLSRDLKNLSDIDEEKYPNSTDSEKS
jgi:hypothetical protein